MPPYHQSYILGYEQTREHTEAEERAELIKAMIPKSMGRGKRK